MKRIILLKTKDDFEKMEDLRVMKALLLKKTRLSCFKMERSVIRSKGF